MTTQKKAITAIFIISFIIASYAITSIVIGNIAHSYSSLSRTTIQQIMTVETVE